MPRPRGAWVRGLFRREVLWPILFGLTFAVCSAALALLARGIDSYRVDEVVIHPIVSRVNLRAIDHEQTAQRRLAAHDREPAVFQPNTGFLEAVRDRLSNLGNVAANPAIDSFEQLDEQARTALKLTPESYAAARRYIAESSPQQWANLVEQFIDGLAGIPVLAPANAKTERDPAERAFKIIVKHPRLGEVEQLDQLIFSTRDVEPARAVLQQRLMEQARVFPDDALRRNVVELVLADLQPTYTLDQPETTRRREAAQAREPVVEQNLTPESLLVQAGARLKPQQVDLLRQEQREYRRQLGPMRQGMHALAIFGLALVLGAALWAYIAAYNPQIARNRMRGLALTVLMLSCQALAVGFSYLWPQLAVSSALFPTLLVTIVLAIAYDQRFALAVGALHALVVVVSLELPTSVALVLLAGVAAAVSQLRAVGNRSKLVVVGTWTGLVMAAVCVAAQVLERPIHVEGQWRLLVTDCLVILATGVGTGLFVQGVLPAIESIFKVTTSMTLKELNDASHPLLRRLASEAPGTYQHSLRLADMAESAANAIGADGLLCKVGAMYHDIGKINKPYYFVENQAGGPNRHNKLSPAMSLLIIVGHVKDGMEMAREYRLPRVLRHFIESHHGTTLVEYFYHAARQKSDEGNTPAPAEFEFRYPGPKPQTREAAIIMICDTLEGAVRTLQEPTPARIEQLVHAMASKRLGDGQFDECNLTLQDLHKIESALTKNLCATYHSRIRYPGDKELPTQPVPPPARADAG